MCVISQSNKIFVTSSPYGKVRKAENSFVSVLFVLKRIKGEAVMS